MTTKSASLERKINLDTPLISLFTLNWEILLYTAIFVVALFTHFYDLGTRVMSHDESLHTLYSWNLYSGRGYEHDPLMHGPFLFHINALIYFLFGDNDFTARISTALFGVVLVILPYWFRPWLGRIGALSASLMLLMSPGITYYSRYIRHDIFISVWTVLMVLAFFQYMRTRHTRWLVVGALSVALMLSTKEVAYIHGFIGVSFIGVMYLWESLPTSKRQLLNYALFGVVFVLVAAVVFLILQAETFTAVTAEGETAGFNPWTIIGILIMITGLVVGLLMIQLGADRTNQPVTQFLRSLPPRLLDIGKAALAAAVIFILLHTTFFTNIYGLYSGTIGEITYWLAQQEVQRGGQPWYYYLFLVPLYEFLPVFVGIIGGLVYLFRGKLTAHADTPASQPVKSKTHQDSDPSTQTNIEEASTVYYPSDGGTFVAFIIYWVLVAFVIYSWAGEKMPWLTVHMTLPLIFLAAHVIQTVLGNFNWSEARQRGGLLLGGALLLVPAALVAITSDPTIS